MWRAVARSAAYDPECWTSIFAAASPISGSALCMFLFAAFLFGAGIIQAPLLLWFCLAAVVCAAVCLRLTHPAQFYDASQASGSFALSLLTGAPRSETASLLLLPPSHSGMLRLAMLDRNWLSAGGSILFGSSSSSSDSKTNRLTEHDLARLSTHVHEVNCSHCSLPAAEHHRSLHSSTINHTSSVPTLCSSTSRSAAAAAAEAVTGHYPAVALPAVQPYEHWHYRHHRQRQQQQQQWGAEGITCPLLDIHSTSSSTTAAAAAAADTSRVGSAADTYRVGNAADTSHVGSAAGWVGVEPGGAMSPGRLPVAWWAPGSPSAPQHQQQQQQQYDTSTVADWFNTTADAGVYSTGVHGGTSGYAAAAGYAAWPLSARSNTADGVRGGGSRSSGRSSRGGSLQAPPWSVQAASAVQELTQLTAQQHSTTVAWPHTMAYNSSSSSSAWELPTGSASLDPAATGPHAAAAAAAAPAYGSAAVEVAPAGSLHQNWPAAAAAPALYQQPSTPAASAGFAALAAHQAALAHSSFHQSLLKACGSYASLDSLDSEGSTVCSICLGTYRPGALLTTLPCGHTFHKDCVMQWLLQQGRRSTCPMCKAEVFA